MHSVAWWCSSYELFVYSIVIIVILQWTNILNTTVLRRFCIDDVGVEVSFRPVSPPGLYHDGHSNENVKNRRHTCILLRNRQIHGEFTVIPSLENLFVAVMVVAIMVIVCGRHCRTLCHLLCVGWRRTSWHIWRKWRPSFVARPTPTWRRRRSVYCWRTTSWTRASRTCSTR